MESAKYNPDDALEAFEKKDYELVLNLAMPHALKGDSYAQVMIALLYDAGFGLERDVLEAERWLLKAAEQNNPVAWNNLGTLYALKLPELQHRWDNAMACYEKAKELGLDVAEPYPPGRCSEAKS